MKRITALSTIAVAVIALIIGRAFPVSVMSNDRVMADVRQSYRSASLVVSGECIQKINSGDNAQSRMLIDEVIAGSAREGSEILVKGSYTVGEKYLLYLIEDDDVQYAEDEVGYCSTSTDNFVIRDGNVEYGGLQIRFSEFRKEMDEISKVITAPSENYYYSDIRALVNAAENIFIGRVNGASHMRSTKFRTQDGGSTVEKKALSANLTISVYGNIKGDIGYGQEINLVYVPSASENMTDAGTLQPKPVSADKAVKLSEGDTYLFFLAKDPDPKQDHCFPVNSIQGWIKVENDKLTVSDENGVAREYTDLSQLVADINKVK